MHVLSASCIRWKSVDAIGHEMLLVPKESDMETSESHAMTESETNGVKMMSVLTDGVVSLPLACARSAPWNIRVKRSYDLRRAADESGPRVDCG